MLTALLSRLALAFRLRRRAPDVAVPNLDLDTWTPTPLPAPELVEEPPAPPAPVTPKVPDIVRRLLSAGFQVWDDGRVQLVGLRKVPLASFAFDDEMVALWHENGAWCERRWPCTTEPTRAALTAPTRAAGTLILASGVQFVDAYEVGLHKGRPALRQDRGKVAGYRDDDLDDVPEITGEYTWDFFGANIHDRAGSVEYASAGCQVLDKTSMTELLDLLKQHGQTVVSYGILDELRTVS
jgi:hypothetical protein